MVQNSTARVEQLLLLQLPKNLTTHLIQWAPEQYWKDPKIPQDSVLAIATSIYQRGRLLKTNSPNQLYNRLLCSLKLEGLWIIELTLHIKPIEKDNWTETI